MQHCGWRPHRPRGRAGLSQAGAPQRGAVGPNGLLCLTLGREPGQSTGRREWLWPHPAPQGCLTPTARLSPIPALSPAETSTLRLAGRRPQAWPRLLGARCPPVTGPLLRGTPSTEPWAPSPQPRPPTPHQLLQTLGRVLPQACPGNALSDLPQCQPIPRTGPWDWGRGEPRLGP